MKYVNFWIKMSKQDEIFAVYCVELCNHIIQDVSDNIQTKSNL